MRTRYSTVSETLMNDQLSFLLSSVYDGDTLAPDHLADLRASSLTHATISQHKFRSVPPTMIPQLLGFDIPAIRSAYLLPFPDPLGGFMNHIRMKVFPSWKDRRGNTVKYFQPRRSGVRLFFPLATIHAALHGDQPLWLIEGEKKSLAVAQRGLPSVGFCGIQGWHLAGSRRLIPDFDHLNLQGRVVELLPDGDCRTNPDVERGTVGLAEALQARGARVNIVLLPVVAA